MSSTIFTMLVWDVNKTTLKAYLKKQKNTCYIKSASENIIAVASKEFMENGKDMGLRTSAELETRTVLLVHSKDYGWGFDAYLNGKETGSFFLNYDTPTDHHWVEDPLFDFAANPEFIEELSKCLTSGQEELIYQNSWRLFETALGIDIYDDYHYDSLDAFPEGLLKDNGIEVVSQKKSSFKKLLEKYIEPYMAQRGFKLDTSYRLPYEYCYFKKVNGYFIGLMIDGSKDYITPKLKTIFGDVLLFDSPRYFKNEEELEQLLKETIEQFDRKMNKNKDKLDFEVFDHEKVFKDHMDEFMLSKGYQVVKSSLGKLTGGEIIYRRIDKDHEIEFSHGQFYLGLSAFYKKGEIGETIRIRDDAGNHTSRTYKNQIEYIAILNRYKHELNKIVQALETELEPEYQEALAAVERNKGKEFSFSKALKRIEAGECVGSGKYRLQKAPDGLVRLGTLQADGTYRWVQPVNYPPILLDLKWHAVNSMPIN